MTINGFDELNTPKVQVEEPEEYFKKMDISPKQRKERVETSKELADVMLFLFALMAIEMQANKPNYPSVLKSFRQRFRDVVSKHSRTDEYVENYINEFTGNVFDTTRRYMEAAGVGVDGRTDAGWWTSVDRATVIGENASNIIISHEELLEAVEAGAVSKSWQTCNDNKVRDTHKSVIKEKIPLEEYFAVGKGVMLYPLDWDNNPDECFNCRCSAVYYDKNGNIVKVGRGGSNARVNKTDEKVQLNTAEKHGTLLSEKDLSSYIGAPIVKGDNQHVREWYYANVHNIPNLIDKNLSLYEQAKQAYGLRTKYKHEARAAMLDKEALEILETSRPALTFEQLLRHKIEDKGMTYEEAIEDIIKTASKTNANVDKEFGL